MFDTVFRYFPFFRTVLRYWVPLQCPPLYSFLQQARGKRFPWIFNFFSGENRGFFLSKGEYFRERRLILTNIFERSRACQSENLSPLTRLSWSFWPKMDALPIRATFHNSEKQRIACLHSRSGVWVWGRDVSLSTWRWPDVPSEDGDFSLKVWKMS